MSLSSSRIDLVSALRVHISSMKYRSLKGCKWDERRKHEHMQITHGGVGLSCNKECSGMAIGTKLMYRGGIYYFEVKLLEYSQIFGFYPCVGAVPRYKNCKVFENGGALIANGKCCMRMKPFGKIPSIIPPCSTIGVLVDLIQMKMWFYQDGVRLPVCLGVPDFLYPAVGISSAKILANFEAHFPNDVNIFD